MRGEILTKMVTTFDKLIVVLEEWSAFKTWIIMWPIDDRMDQQKFRRLLQLVKTLVDSEGKVVTAWPPVNEKNSVKWNGIAELWSSLDDALARIDNGSQIFCYG